MREPTELESGVCCARCTCNLTEPERGSWCARCACDLPEPESGSWCARFACENQLSARVAHRACKKQLRPGVACGVPAVHAIYQSPRVARGVPAVQLELELIQTHMAQKPMLRAEVYAHAMRASQNRKKEVRREKKV